MSVFEQWRLIDGYDNYQVSDQGRVRNSDTKRILKGRHNSNGYLTIGIRKNNLFINYYIHRLVAFAFLLEKKKKKQTLVDHIDGDKNNNVMSNLRWCTAEENSRNKQKTRKENGYGSQSIYKGVRPSQNGKKWIATITKKGHLIYIGTYQTERQAGIAYNIASARLFGEFAKINNMSD